LTSAAVRRLGIPRICHHRWIFDGSAINWFNKYGCERHVFVSEALRTELCSNAVELAGAPHAVVYDGLQLPPVTSQADKITVRRELGLPEDQSLVLFAGQIIERKGVGEVIDAWTLLQQNWQERAQLVIVGDDLEGQGEYRRRMQQRAAQIGCQGRFVGFQKNVRRWLTAADIVLVPSHAEPLGNATLEAMSHGLPVVGTCVGGIPEMILHEQTGLLVPAKSPEALAAAVNRLLQDRLLCARLGDSGRQRCEQLFTLKVHVQNMLMQYRAALGSQPQKAIA
jgi:glycosyltransferase involved in cell wall biosynthesis